MFGEDWATIRADVDFKALMPQLAYILLFDQAID